MFITQTSIDIYNPKLAIKFPIDLSTLKIYGLYLPLLNK